MSDGTDDGVSRRGRVGLVFLPVDAAETVDLIIRAEQAGVDSVWLEMNAIGLDPFPLLAAAAMRTERIGLGTAITPAFGRHPAAMATQALALEGLAPGRFRLGVGTGNAARMQAAFGHPPDRPLDRLREYVQVLRPILHDGRVRFGGEFYTAEVEVPAPSRSPVLLSALGPRAFALAGELADGALSWMCPVEYLLTVAKSALASGAALARRPVPPLVAHVPVALGRASAARREAVRDELGRYARVPVFARMLAEAGHPVADGVVSDALLDSLVVWGDADAVATRLATLLERGVDELMVSHTPEAADREREDTLLEVLGGMVTD